jgi:5'(3')-deoxyribonucleotidase
MKRLVIAVDCDDVLVSTTPFFVDAYNRTHGTNVTLDKAHSNDEHWQTDRKTLEARLAALMETDEYKQLRPIDIGVEVLTELSRHHELHVITARRPDERGLTEHMLDTHLPGVFTSLELVGFSGSKGEVCERIHADVLIDDSIRHLNDAMKHGVAHAGLILFGGYPWNMQEKTQKSFNACDTWNDVKERIDEFAGA